jgi:hypothetical protein
MPHSTLLLIRWNARELRFRYFGWPPRNRWDNLLISYSGSVANPQMGRADQFVSAGSFVLVHLRLRNFALGISAFVDHNRALTYT